MQVHHSIESIALHNSWLTIGVFDGVHRGHQAILKTLVRGALETGAPAVVLTFDPHPLSILRPGHKLEMLTSLEERKAFFEATGVDALIAHPFNANVASLSAEAFLTQLKMRTGFSHMLVGHDFAMGRNREGDIPHLRKLETRLGFSLHVVQPFINGEAPVSSSRIRSTLREGRVDLAGEMLGRPYQLSGRVVRGEQRGRKIGVPTANLEVPADRLVPAPGVYACRASLAGRTYPAATNIGVRPTFDGQEAPATIETHLLDFEGEIYGDEVRIAFIRRLRGEHKFDSVDALVAQIRTDVHRTREVLNETVP